MLKNLKEILTKEFLIREYTENKKSTYKIAKIIGCSRSIIIVYLKEFEIPRRTISQAVSGKNNSKYIDGRSIRPHRCKICNKKISQYSDLYGKCRCVECAIDEKTNKDNHMPHFCIDCDNSICYHNWKKGKGRCHSCANKITSKLRWNDKKYRDNFKKKLLKRWQNENFRQKIVQNTLKSLSISPNNPETLLLNLLENILPKEYKFVGDGEIVLSKYCPDFINCKGQKKIIELFGCYWHKCPQCNFGKSKLRPKDVGRLKTYKKHGYNTLIIWEHELKNQEQVISKIMEFNHNA